MSGKSNAVCKLCRREKMKLFLKGTRCETDKCGFERRGYVPGQHGQKRRKDTEYGLQLREKQKVKRIYGIREKQFRRFFGEAARVKGKTGEVLLQLLERRLDNTLYRMGYAESRRQGRQVVKHGLVTVNGRKRHSAGAVVTSVRTGRNGTITITPCTGVRRVSIIDAAGRLLRRHSVPASGATAVISGLSPGVHFIGIEYLYGGTDFVKYIYVERSPR